MDKILIKEIKKKLSKNYSKADAEQIINYIDNYFMKELSREEKSDIVEGILEMNFREENEN